MATAITGPRGSRGVWKNYSSSTARSPRSPKPDLAARNALAEAHASWALGIARDVAGRVPTSVTAGDLSGTAYLGLLRAATAFDPRRGIPFRKYAGRVVYAECWRAALHGRVVQDADACEDAVCQRPSQHEEVERAETSARVTRLLARLPRRHRAVVCLYYNGWTMTDIGRRFGVGRSWVSQLHKEALRMLREAQ